MRPRCFLIVALVIVSLAGCAQGPASSKESEVKTDVVTYHRDVAPILNANCASCHRPGEAAPFSLFSYADAKRRSSQIAEVTRRRFMPPWLPEQGHETFAGARRLTDGQIETLQQWAKAGAPEGAEIESQAALRAAGKWQLGEPDIVLE